MDAISYKRGTPVTSISNDLAAVGAQLFHVELEPHEPVVLIRLVLTRPVFFGGGVKIYLWNWGIDFCKMTLKTLCVK